MIEKHSGDRIPPKRTEANDWTGFGDEATEAEPDKSPSASVGNDMAHTWAPKFSSAIKRVREKLRRGEAADASERMRSLAKAAEERSEINREEFKKSGLSKFIELTKDEVLFASVAMLVVAHDVLDKAYSTAGALGRIAAAGAAAVGAKKAYDALKGRMPRLASSLYALAIVGGVGTVAFLIYDHAYNIDVDPSIGTGGGVPEIKPKAPPQVPEIKAPDVRVINKDAPQEIVVSVLKTPVIAGKESVWSALYSGLKKLDVVSHQSRTYFAEAFQRVIDSEGLQNELLGRTGKAISWTAIPDGTAVHFNKLFSDPDFVEKMGKLLASDKKYLPLVRELDGLEMTPENFVKYVAKMYTG